MQDFPLREIVCNKKRYLYGVIDGYAVSVCDLRPRSGDMTFETAGTNGFGNMRDMLMRNKFVGFSVITGAIGNGYLQFTLKFKDDATPEAWSSAIYEILQIARQFWYVPYDRCVICHKRRTDTLGLHRGCYRHLHRECVEKSVEKAVARASGTGGIKPVLGAVGGALCVLILNLVVLMVAKTSFSLIYLFTAFLSWYGFELAHGTNSRRSAIMIIGISAVTTIVSELVAAAVGSGIADYFLSPLPILLAYGFTAVGVGLAASRIFYGSDKIVNDKKMVLDTLVDIPVEEPDEVSIEIVDD